ncbi:hypothetical protein V6N13_081081 [Hibiscus sabdariffa]|uniref:Uncharacterized protein n=1 Tax=Hibiscus sabdariffa TaxID=183260 RepID=A0ABR2DBG1_9ROSI
MVKASLRLNVDNLIKKLVKKGRHAELWPEKSEQKEKKRKSKNKDKQGSQANTEEDKQVLVSFVPGNQSPMSKKKGGDNESKCNSGGSDGGAGSKKKTNGNKGNASINFEEGDHPADARPTSIGAQFIGHGPHGHIPISVPIYRRSKTE